MHIYRFGSPILKFKTNCMSNSNKLLVLLSDGFLKIFNLMSLEQELSLKVFNINPQ